MRYSITTIVACLAVLTGSVAFGQFSVTDVQTGAEFTIAGNVPPTPVPLVSQIGYGTGRTYTNVLGSVPATQGTPVHTIGMVTLGTLTSEGFPGIGVDGIDVTKPTIRAIFTLQGEIETVFAPTSGATRFSGGQLTIFKDETSGGSAANAFSPSTWFPSASDDVLATYSLKNPEPIISGTQFDVDGAFPPGSPLDLAMGINRPAADVNLSAGNIAIMGGIESLLLFEELNDDVDGNNLDLFTSESGIDLFLDNLANEVIITTQQDPIEDALTHNAIDDDDLDALNTLFNNVFATDFAPALGSGADENFFIDLAGNATSLDFIASPAGQAFPGVQVVVPEPGSISLWALMALAACVFAVRRCRRRN